MKRIHTSCSWCQAKQNVLDLGGNYIHCNLISFHCFYCNGYNHYDKNSNNSKKVGLVSSDKPKFGKNNIK